MSNPVDPLLEATRAMHAAWPADSAGVTGMSDAALLELNQQIADAHRHLDALHSRVAAEMASRSRPELGKSGLARQAGFRTPAKLIAAATGGHTGDAARLIQAGQATAPRLSLTGEKLPPKHPFVAAALEAGSLSVPAAAALTTMLDKLPPRVSTEQRLAAEQSLAEHAPLLSLDELQDVLRRAEAALDPDGLEPRIDELRSQRSLKIVKAASGATLITICLDPESAGPVVAAIEGIVTHQLRVSRGHNRPAHSGSDPSTVDAPGAPSGEASDEAEFVSALGAETRSLSQMNVDALVAICRHVLGCDQKRVPGSSTTVVVRMSLDQIQPDATGVATIDGLEQPIDAGTARRLAATAGIIPAVLGTDSEVLDLGREKRHFSKAQRLIYVERDGGCSGCHLPPAFTEAHHLRLWSHGGTTDLDDGVLLCTGCHHRVHDEGWEIRVMITPGAPPHTGEVWFIPPAHVDPARRPRLGGRRRFDPLAWNLAA